MKLDELIESTYVNEEDLSFRDRLKLSRLSKEKPSDTLLALFNKQPNFLRDYEKVYFAKYLNKDYTFYKNGEDVYVAPEDTKEEELSRYFIPTGSEKHASSELYETMGIGFRNLRVYSVLPGAKYKLIKGKGLSGYPSVDKPWELFGSKIEINSNNLLDFYRKSRKFLGPKKCKIAYQCYDQKVTWEELEEMINKYIKALSAAGVKENDVVPICITSTIEATALYFACDTIGATTFFIDPNETNKETINKYFNRFNSKITFATCADLEKIKESASGTNISNIITISPTDSMDPNDNISKYSKEYIKKYTVPFEENDLVSSLGTFIRNGEKYTGDINYCYDNDHISLITSTSSSTGEPKLIELSRKNIMFELETIKKTTNIFLGPNGINMQVVPFKYPYGFIVSTLITPYVGKTGGLTPDFSLQDYAKFFDMYRPKYVHTIPSHIKHMAKNEDPIMKDLTYMDFLVSGGDKFEAAAKDKCNQEMARRGSKAKVKDCSGMAEITAGITAATVGKYNIESVGKPMLGTIVKAVDENGKELPYGHVGKLYYTGQNVMQRYNNDEEKTNEIKMTDKDGVTWIVTDSYGFVDNEGFVYMCGRDRDFFITYPPGRPPFKVYVDFVEKVLNSCDEVFDCVVVKKPNDITDCISRAYVVLKPGIPEEKYDIILDHLYSECREKLDACAVPEKIEIVPSLKLKPSMKTDKNYYIKLAEQEYEEEQKVKGL